MPVAKSYQDLEIVEDVYTVGNREYVKVKTKSGALKQVRWYSCREYEKMYPGEAVKDPFYKSQKDLLGFKNGYITIFKGNTYECKDALKAAGARYTRWWGWAFSSENELPETLPEGIEPLKLNWDLVGNGENLKNESDVIAAVESVIYEPDDSEFIGSIGEKLELYLTIEKIVKLDGYYGQSTMYVMYDDEGNTFIWTTSSNKNWEEGEEYHIKGTVKDHKIYKNRHQTVLTRCKEY